MRTILICMLIVFGGCENPGKDVKPSMLYVVDGERALGNRATERLRSLISSVPTVKLVIEPRLDKYGRGLARMFVNGTDVGKILISEGLARPYDGGKRQSWCLS